ncbi:hypothetical protein [Nostoc sp.]|uniref:hypothetical protein n=1 Tax=Nostoc sp. TaxID=1180 RepID=UPI002FF86A30
MVYTHLENSLLTLQPTNQNVTLALPLGKSFPLREFGERCPPEQGKVFVLGNFMTCVYTVGQLQFS